LRENPAWLQGVVRTWKLGELDRDLFDSRARLFVTAGRREDCDIILDAPDLEALHPALRLRLYKQALEALGPGQPLMDNLMRLDAAWRDRSGRKTIQFPGAKTACLESGAIRFSAAG
jgi:tRNA(Ile)-lysidine synthase